MMRQIEQYGMIEFEVHYDAEGNPFQDCTVKGIFKGDNEEKKVRGFYDGKGTFKVRFMPSFEGIYTLSLIHI